MRHSSPDIIVGLPSYNEYHTISEVARRADEGLVHYFPKKSALIVNVDNSPHTRTKQAFIGSHTQTPKHYIHTHASKGHKGSNMRALFSFFLDSGANALVTMDTDLRNNDPEWVRLLADPIMRGYDHVFPLYRRHQYDGSITNLLCYPVIYGMLGHAIRQPIGGEMGLSRRAVKAFLNRPWPHFARRFGVDIFMTITSIVNHMKMGQVHLGAKKHKPSGPNLDTMFYDVAETLIYMIRDDKLMSLDNRNVCPCRTINASYRRVKNGQLSIDGEALRRRGVAELRAEKKTIDVVLGKTYRAHLVMHPEAIDTAEWTMILYHFITASRSLSPVVLARALRPLYFLRFYHY